MCEDYLNLSETFLTVSLCFSFCFCFFSVLRLDYGKELSIKTPQLGILSIADILRVRMGGGVLQMRTSELFVVKNSEFFENYAMFARIREGSVDIFGQGGGRVIFCDFVRDVFYGWPQSI